MSNNTSLVDGENKKPFPKNVDDVPKDDPNKTEKVTKLERKDMDPDVGSD
jgi:hypothetical protein